MADPHADHAVLRRILAPCVGFEDVTTDGLLCVRFEDGTRLSFGCGPSGRLNMVVVQHGPDTPELRARPPELPPQWTVVEHAVAQHEPCGESSSVLVARVEHPDGHSAEAYVTEEYARDGYRVWFDVRGADADVVRWLMHRAQVAAAAEAPVDALDELRGAEDHVPWLVQDPGARRVLGRMARTADDLRDVAKRLRGEGSEGSLDEARRLEHFLALVDGSADDAEILDGEPDADEVTEAGPIATEEGGG